MTSFILGSVIGFFSGVVATIVMLVIAGFVMAMKDAGKS